MEMVDDGGGGEQPGEESDGGLLRALNLLPVPVDMSKPFRVGVVLARLLPQSAKDLVVVSMAPRMAIDKGETGDFFYKQ